MPGSLKGRVIVLTRPSSQAEGFATDLKALGARVLPCPSIRIAPPRSYRPLDQAIRSLATYDWVIFTSANGVEQFMGRYRRALQPKAALHSLKAMAIGPATASAMRKAGIPVAKTSTDYVAESVLKSLGNLRGQKVLIPSAEETRDVLPKGLKARGAAVHAVAAYRTLPEKNRPKAFSAALKAGQIDCVTFTSSSTVKNFLGLLTGRERRALKGGKISAASIGPVTTGTLKAAGWAPVIVARKPTSRHLLRAILKHYQKGQT